MAITPTMIYAAADVPYSVHGRDRSGLQLL
jgi:hypothetical protein